MSDKNVVTQEGLKQLKEELAFRSGKKKEELRNSLEAMKAAGDVSENEGYSLTLDEIDMNTARIAELEKMIEKAIVSETITGKIHIGSEVTIEGEDKKTYKIVGEQEANPLENKISHLSPLGSKLFGKQIGDIVTFQKPNGTESTYKITDLK